MIKKLDRIIKESLRQLAADSQVQHWRAKENDWVNYFAHRYLIGKCSPDSPLKDVAQICIEVNVSQPRRKIRRLRVGDLDLVVRFHAR